jgi:hypothetical protein
VEAALLETHTSKLLGPEETFNTYTHIETREYIQTIGIYTDNLPANIRSTNHYTKQLSYLFLLHTKCISTENYYRL